MSSPGPGKGKKKRKSKGRGGAGRGRGRGQNLPTPGRHEGAGKPVDDDEVEVESEEKPATGATSDDEPSSSTAAEYDELPETGRERPRENEMTANEKVHVGEGGKTPSSSTAVAQPQEKSKGKRQVPGASKSSTSSPSSGTKVKEPQSVAASNTSASTPVPSTVTAAAAAAETAGVSAATSIKTAGVSKTTADDKQDEEQLTKLDSSLTTKARQTQGNGGPHPPKRPGYGTVGRPIRLRANFFRLNISSQLSDLYHYDVAITPKKCPRAVKRDVVNEIIRRYKDTTFQGHHPAFDGGRNLYSRIKLPPAELSVKLAGEDGEDREFKVKIQFAGSVSCLELNNFLSGKQNGKVPQDAVQGWNIVMQEMLSFYYTRVGRSFFPFDAQGRPLGEGCEARFGYRSSVRHSEWKAPLVNIDG